MSARGRGASGYFARRVLAACAALFVILTLAFCATRFMPGHAYDDPSLDPEIAEAMRARAHLDEPVLVQYGYFLRAAVFEGDWGVSTRVEPQMPVFGVLARRIPASLALNFISLALALPLGAALGVFAAAHRGKKADTAVSVGIIIFISAPSFVVAALLQYVLAYRLELFPLLFEPSAPPALRAWSMALPVFALMLHPVATVTRYMRGELAEIAPQEFIALARTKGYTRFEAMLRHGVRNAAIPLASVILPMLAQLVGGSMVIERLFSVPGVGGALISAIAVGDHSLTVAALVFYAGVSISAALLADVLYGLLDPRVRVGDKPL